MTHLPQVSSCRVCPVSRTDAVWLDAGLRRHDDRGGVGKPYEHRHCGGSGLLGIHDQAYASIARPTIGTLIGRAWPGVGVANGLHAIGGNAMLN